MIGRARVLVTALLLVVFLVPSIEGRAVELARAGSFSVTAWVGPTDLLLGESTVLTGLVSPVRSGTKVRIQQEQPTGWVTIAKWPMSPAGAYGNALTPPGVGTFVYRARMPKVGAIAAANSPTRTVTVVDEALIVFTIPPGTGAGSWNTSATPVVGKVGDTLRLVNGDSMPHRLHTDGDPFGHPAASVGPGQVADYVLNSSFTGALYCHDHGMNSKFWITVTGPGVSRSSAPRLPPDPRALPDL